MPELPEVESTVSSLRQEIIGKTIVGVKATWPRMLEPYSPRTLKRRITGYTVADVKRRAKCILITLSNSKDRDTSSFTLLIHLRMSGRLQIVDAKSSSHPHARVILSFDDGSECRFIDPRKFGRCTLLTQEELDTRLCSYGPEPLDARFSSRAFFNALQLRKRALKPLLLDQQFIAGIGNIYADESLWEARLHPLRSAHDVSLKEASVLLKAIKRILRSAIRLNGTDFGDGVVHNGQFEPRVYGRGGEPCPRCGMDLTRLVVAQRGTVVCNTCQS